MSIGFRLLHDERKSCTYPSLFCPLQSSFAPNTHPTNHQIFVLFLIQTGQEQFPLLYCSCSQYSSVMGICAASLLVNDDDDDDTGITILDTPSEMFEELS